MNISSSASAVQLPVFALLYDDFASGARAKQFANNCSSDPHDETVWHFERLREPEGARQAAQAAAKADFVVLSLSGRESIPSSVKQWLGYWLGSLPGSAATLIAMFDPERAQPGFIHSMCDYLETVTRLAGAKFQLKSGDTVFPKALALREGTARARTDRDLQSQLL